MHAASILVIDSATLDSADGTPIESASVHFIVSDSASWASSIFSMKQSITIHHPEDNDSLTIEAILKAAGDAESSTYKCSFSASSQPNDDGYHSVHLTNDDDESIYISMKMTAPKVEKTEEKAKVEADKDNATTNLTKNDGDGVVIVDDGTDDELDDHVDLEIDTIENTVVDHTANGVADNGKAYDTSAAAAAEVALKESMSQSMAMAAQEGFNFVYVHQSYILFAAASIGIFFYGDYASL